MKKLVLALSVFLSVVAFADDWEYLSGVTLKKARQSHKPIALFIYKPTCPYCTHFIQATLENQEVKAILKRHYILAMVDASKNTPPVAYTITPSFAFIDGNVQQLVDTAAGDIPPDMFLPFIKQVTSALTGRY